ncbi:hypothetical protein HGRIS_009495 [Hohenbuehelia grisea]|uniref:PIN domain-containing protein n=1 Tax=Hohenbuehelia grisea TaxID=104357 RepID=A0ABR3J1H9_9AGAR
MFATVTNRDQSTAAAPLDHLHATLVRIDELANDVEMTAAEPLPFEDVTFIVIDTNILLIYFDALKEFVEDLEAAGLARHISVVIPGAVIGELDGQKNREGLAWSSRRASAWILAKVRERRAVRGQADWETRMESGSWKKRDPEHVQGERLTWGEVNDLLIRDCCEYFLHNVGRPTFLCSADNNLCALTQFSGVELITPERDSVFYSRKIAQTVLGDGHELLRSFRLAHAKYQSASKLSSRGIPDSRAWDSSQGRGDRPSVHLNSLGNELTRDDDVDMMDVDEDPRIDRDLPSHPLDLLHIQICEHFSALLVELVGKIGTDLVTGNDGGVSQSVHAPRWTRNTKRYWEWSPDECLEYLRSKKRIPTDADNFLRRHPARLARRGQEWPTAQWEKALESLAEIGEAFGEGSFQESLGVLYPHLSEVLLQKMRPTGT